jgi:O-antigen/teichoic acid export membrane protein
MVAEAAQHPSSTEAEHRASFFRQSGWLMLATIGGGVLMWGVHFLSKAPSVTKAEYAVFGVFLAVAMSIPTLPLQMVMAQQTAYALATGRQRQLAGMIRLVLGGTFLLWLLAAALVLGFQGPIITRFEIANPVGLWLTLLVVLLQLWLPVFWGVLQGRQDFLWLGWSMISSGVGRIAIAALAVLVFGGAAAGMMTGVLLGLLLAAAIAVWQTRSLWGLKSAPFHWGQLLAQVVPLMLGFAMFQFLFTADTIFSKAYFQGENMAAYVAAGTMARALMWLVGPLASVMFPRIVHSAAKSQKTDLVKIVLLGTAVLAATGALSLWVLGPWVIRFVTKPSYVEVATTLLPWYAFAMVPLAVANVLLNNLLAQGRFKMVPALCALALAYALALTQFHDSMVTVLKTLGIFNCLLLAICAWFTWFAKPEPSKLDQPVT